MNGDVEHKADRNQEVSLSLYWENPVPWRTGFVSLFDSFGPLSNTWFTDS